MTVVIVLVLSPAWRTVPVTAIEQECGGAFTEKHSLMAFQANLNNEEAGGRSSAFQPETRNSKPFAPEVFMRVGAIHHEDNA